MITTEVILHPTYCVGSRGNFLIKMNPMSTLKIFFDATTKTRLFKYIENFTTKNWKFSDKNSDIFRISAKNKDCGYSLGLPQWGGSNEYPQSMFLSRNKKNIRIFIWKLSVFGGEIFSIPL